MKTTVNRKTLNQNMIDDGQVRRRNSFNNHVII